MTKLKILLISPPYARFMGTGNASFPLSLGTMATILSETGHDVAIYDADFDPRFVGKSQSYYSSFLRQMEVRAASADGNHEIWHEVRQTIMEFNPDLIGISAMTSKYPMVTTIAEIAREIKPDAKIVIGGHHASIFGEQLLQNKNLDFVIAGEGENTFSELVAALVDSQPDFSSIKGLIYKDGGKIITNPARPLIENLDTLPIANRALILNKDYVSENNIMTSRGCPFNCSYCGAKVIWSRKVRRRSVAKIIAEIEYLFSQSSSRHISFWDDSFTCNREYTLELMAELKKIKGLQFSCITRLDLIDHDILVQLKDAGCTSILFGIESGNDNVLRLMDKKMTMEQIAQQTAIVDAVGIPWLGFFIMGYPGEKKENILQTLDFMKKLNPSWAEINIFNPLPGTDIWNRLENMELVSSNMDFSKNSQASTENCFVEDMSRSEFKCLALFVAKEFDLHNKQRGGSTIIKRVRSKLGKIVKRVVK